MLLCSTQTFAGDARKWLTDPDGSLFEEVLMVGLGINGDLLRQSVALILESGLEFSGSKLRFGTKEEPNNMKFFSLKGEFAPLLVTLKAELILDVDRKEGTSTARYLVTSVKVQEQVRLKSFDCNGVFDDGKKISIAVKYDKLRSLMLEPAHQIVVSIDEKEIISVHKWLSIVIGGEENYFLGAYLDEEEKQMFSINVVDGEISLSFLMLPELQENIVKVKCTKAE